MTFNKLILLLSIIIIIMIDNNNNNIQSKGCWGGRPIIILLWVRLINSQPDYLTIHNPDSGF